MKRDFALLKGRHFDLLVCGGGIYGAWTAYDAALRGLSVAIVEQGDWAAATSSASSKLIHGGLRYLETYDFKLVKKALAERQLLLELAPHRVWPLRFGVPLYKDSRIGSLQMKAGLMLYDFLAGLPGKNIVPDISHRHFDSTAFSERFPILTRDGLKGGLTYFDAQTDDARLVLELISGAMAAGAVCVNYCKMTGLAETGGQVCGATIQDQLTHRHAQILARQVVNATGQWIAASEPGRNWCRLTKGVHLVMPAALANEALLLTAPSDGRVFFLIPWYGMTLLGTTDTEYSGNAEHVVVEPEEVAYLLAAANHYLKVAWTEADIAGRYAGVRMMKQSGEISPSSVSRDWELKTANNGVHYSIGGKLTSAREDAAHIVDTVCVQLGVNASCATGNRRFPWAPETEFDQWSLDISARAKQIGVDQESAKWLIRRHGKRVEEILRSMEGNSRLAERIVPALPLVYADLLFCARNEMVIHLEDLLRRRLPLLILAQLSETIISNIAKIVAASMGRDETTIGRKLEQ